MRAPRHSITATEARPNLRENIDIRDHPTMPRLYAAEAGNARAARWLGSIGSGADVATKPQYCGLIL
jgi:hypothetical protein